jgi:hypothetical protein
MSFKNNAIGTVVPFNVVGPKYKIYICTILEVSSFTS